MNHSGLARMLNRAKKLAESSPTPEAEIPEEESSEVIEHIKEAVTPVVVAIEDAKAIKAEEDVTSVNPPAVFATKPAPAPEPVVEVDENAEPEPMTFRQARMISWLGMIRVKDQLVGIHMLTRDLDERELINASWDKALASECIDALTNGSPYHRPDGWTVYLNRAAYKKYQAKKAS